jgi:hypothetical protein
MIRCGLLGLISAVIFAAGCKKTPQQPVASKPQLSSINQVRSNGNPHYWVEEFTYREDVRIKEIKSYGINSILSLIQYDYSDASIDRYLYMNGTERTSSRLYYTINQANLIASETSTFYKYKMEHHYNAKGFLAKTNFSIGVMPNGYIAYSYGQQDRLDSLVYHLVDSSVGYVSVFTYSTDKRNTIGKENKGQQMFGKDQAWPLLKETKFVYNDPNAFGKRSKQFDLEYSYTYDEKGLIRTSTLTRIDYTIPGGNSSFQEVGSFEYSYK